MSATNLSPTRTVGEVTAYVQSLGLKVVAADLLRFTNSPSTCGTKRTGGVFNMLYTSMKRLPVNQLSLILSVAVLPVAIQAQELPITEQARVPGKISDGTPSIRKNIIKPSQDFKINWSQVKYVNGQKFTINKVEPPVPPVKKQQTAADRAKSEREYQELLKTMKPSGGAFMVFATIYDHNKTLVTFNHEGEEYKVWSNLDWNLLCGFASFEGREKRYSMMLLPSNASTETIKAEKNREIEASIAKIPPLPDLSTKGPHYTVIDGDVDNDEAMEFLEAIHDLYAVEETRLKTAYEARKINWKIRAEKEAELRKNPPPKPDITISFWERDVVKERREAKAAKALETSAQKGGQR